MTPAPLFMGPCSCKSWFLVTQVAQAHCSLLSLDSTATLPRGHTTYWQVHFHYGTQLTCPTISFQHGPTTSSQTPPFKTGSPTRTPEEFKIKNKYPNLSWALPSPVYLEDCPSGCIRLLTSSRSPFCYLWNPPFALWLLLLSASQVCGTRDVLPILRKNDARKIWMTHCFFIPLPPLILPNSKVFSALGAVKSEGGEYLWALPHLGYLQGKRS
jgi:hypothetical protein